LAEHRGIHVEDRELVLRVGAVEVRVVPQHEPEVGAARAREREIHVAHRGGAGQAGSGVAQHPDAGRLRRSRDRGRDEEIGEPPASVDALVPTE
jgi:hypothetical protein